MHKKILLTGSNGFLGRSIRSSELSKSYEFIDVNVLYNKRIDISKPFTLPDNLGSNIVFHVAGKAHSIPRTLEQEEEFFQVNYQGTVNLCNALEKLKTKPEAFIFMSTVAVYGVHSGIKIKEDCDLNGTSPYARSKIKAEQFLEEWALRNNVILSILRLPLVVGHRPPGNLSAMIKGIKSGKYLSVGNADARKSVLWAQDIVKILPKLSEIGGIYNLTDGYDPSFGELEDSICKALKRPHPKRIPLWLARAIASFGDIIGHKAPINTSKLNKMISTLTFDDTKAKNVLGWQPTKVLSKIKEIV